MLVQGIVSVSETGSKTGGDGINEHSGGDKMLYVRGLEFAITEGNKWRE